MFIRIVRMYFRAASTEEFVTLFEQHESSIRHFQGCSYLRLLRDAEDSCCYTTLSHWDSLDNLKKYRNSELFKTVWAKTKILFAKPPQAFSLKHYTEF